MSVIRIEMGDGLEGVVVTKELPVGGATRLDSGGLVGGFGGGVEDRLIDLERSSERRGSQSN